MSMESQRTCPSCGNELSGAMEFCPVCMLRKGLAGGVESGESSSEDILKLTPEQATQRFEHYELVKGEDGNPVELGRGAMGINYKADNRRYLRRAKNHSSELPKERTCRFARRNSTQAAGKNCTEEDFHSQIARYRK
jgi:hypothetical protein